VGRSFWLGLARDWGIALLAAIGLFVGASYLFGPSGPVGGTAPPLRGVALDGAAFDLALEPEVPILLNFWATWCGPCRHEIPEISAFATEHPEVIVIGVSVDEGISLQRLARFAQTTGVTYRIVLDDAGRDAGRWGVSTLPTTFALSADRHIASSRVGTVDRKVLGQMLQDARTHAH
jgi:thiol-disulfide isomerase/thioredoxin